MLHVELKKDSCPFASFDSGFSGSGMNEGGPAALNNFANKAKQMFPFALVSSMKKCLKMFEVHPKKAYAVSC